MKGVELYGRVRDAVQSEGLSHREAARQFGIDPRTVAKMVKFSVPPGYVRKKPPARPKLDTNHGLVTDVCLKRKVRNYIALTKGGEQGYNIYMAERAVLNRAHHQSW